MLWSIHGETLLHSALFCRHLFWNCISKLPIWCSGGPHEWFINDFWGVEEPFYRAECVHPAAATHILLFSLFILVSIACAGLLGTALRAGSFRINFHILLPRQQINTACKYRTDALPSSHVSDMLKYPSFWVTSCHPWESWACLFVFCQTSCSRGVSLFPLHCVESVWPTREVKGDEGESSEERVNDITTRLEKEREKLNESEVLRMEGGRRGWSWGKQLGGIVEHRVTRLWLFPHQPESQEVELLVPALLGQTGNAEVFSRDKASLCVCVCTW